MRTKSMTKEITVKVNVPKPHQNNKEFFVTENQILERFVEMCAESIEPDLYDVLISEVNPRLLERRKFLGSRGVDDNTTIIDDVNDLLDTHNIECALGKPDENGYFVFCGRCSEDKAIRLITGWADDVNSQLDNRLMPGDIDEEA
jgi:hypothetical protein